MQPGIASIDTMPRLCLLLRAGTEILVGGPTSPQASRSDGKPLMGRATAWIAATARAQRLMEINGSADLFSAENPLTVEISGARRGGALADAVDDGLNRASNALARGFLALARRLGDSGATPTRLSRAALSAAKALPWTSAEPDAFMLISERASTDAPVSKINVLSTVRLPARSTFLNTNGSFALASPFWSQEERATYIALHEFGHSAHHLRGSDAGLYFGTELMSGPELNLFAALGVYPVAPGQLPAQFALRLGEGYADCFAALGLGGGDLKATLRACDQVEAFRNAMAPARETNYSGSDPLHDTRESCKALRETLVAAGRCPMNASEVDQLCMRATQIGAARWVASISSRPVGGISELVWLRGHEAVAALPPATADVYAASYSTERDKALDIPWLHELAESLPASDDPSLTAASASARSASLSLLIAIHKTCGGPRLENLRGGQANAPSLESLGERLRSRAAVEDNDLACGPARMRHG